MKKILLAAGTGIYVRALDRLETGLKQRGLAGQYSITKCKVPELKKQAPGFDLVIRTALLTDTVDTPVINGVGLATGGQAAEAALDEIAAFISSDTTS